MSRRILKCEYCGKEFEALRSNMIYCSRECRIKARYSRESKAEKNKDFENVRREKFESLKRFNDERISRDKAELIRRAEQGEPRARMILLTSQGLHHTLDYFIAYRENVLENDEKFNKASAVTIGGVDVYRYDFEDEIQRLLDKGKKLTIVRNGFRRL